MDTVPCIVCLLEKLSFAMRSILFHLLIVYTHAQDQANKHVLIKTKSGKSYLAKLGSPRHGTEELDLAKTQSKGFASESKIGSTKPHGGLGLDYSLDLG